MTTKLLIIYASAGDGHKKAAEAIYEDCLDIDGVEPVLIDSLDYSTRFFGYSYKRSYMIMIKYLPWVWGFFYYLLNNRFFFGLNRFPRYLFNRLNTRKLARFLLKRKFDAVISTHFLAPEVISTTKIRKGLRLPLINVVTDFMPHLFWEARGVDKYAVASEITKQAFTKRGIPEEMIEVTGIPVRKKFNAIIPKVGVREKIGIDSNLFTILIMGGGAGVGPIEKMVLGFQVLGIECQIIVVCGHNKRLFKRLNSSKQEYKKPTHIHGFCMNIDEFMAASDIMISKSGGMTVSEAAAKSLPVFTIRPIPGQETNNAEFVFKRSAGLTLKNVEEVMRVTEDICNNPERLKAFRNNMGKIAMHEASSNIINLALSTTDRGNRASE